MRDGCPVSRSRRTRSRSPSIISCRVHSARADGRGYPSCACEFAGFYEHAAVAERRRDILDVHRDRRSGSRPGRPRAVYLEVRPDGREPETCPTGHCHDPALDVLARASGEPGRTSAQIGVRLLGLNESNMHGGLREGGQEIEAVQVGPANRPGELRRDLPNAGIPVDA